MRRDPILWGYVVVMLSYSGIFADMDEVCDPGFARHVVVYSDVYSPTKIVEAIEWMLEHKEIRKAKLTRDGMGAIG